MRKKTYKISCLLILSILLNLFPITANGSELKIISIKNLTVSLTQNQKYSLPKTIKANMSDKTIKDVNVSWDKNEINTKRIGMYYIFKGTVKGYSPKVELVLYVISSNGITNKITPTPTPIINSDIDLKTKFVFFPDPVFEQIVRSAIGKMNGSLSEFDLMNLEHLKSTNYDQNVTIKSLEGIQYLTSLYDLQLDNYGITNISKLSELKYLFYLSLSDNKITDISPLKKFKLFTLTLNNNQITTLPRDMSYRDMLVLNLNNNKISDISVLGNCKKLSNLSLENNKISSFEPIRQITTLTRVSLKSTGFYDLSCLELDENIEYIDLTNNDVKDVTALSRFKKLESLKLVNNKITDISALKNKPNLNWLQIDGNKIIDISALKDMNELKNLSLDMTADNYEPLSNLSKLTYLTFTNIDYSKLRTAYNVLKKIALNNTINVDFLWDIRDSRSFRTVSSFRFTNKELLQEEYMNKIVGMIDRFEETKKDILDKISSSLMSDYDKIYYIYNWMINNVSYDDDYYSKNIQNPFNYDFVGVLGSQKRVAICAGYSDTVTYLLNLAGIDCQTIEGTATGKADWQGVSRQGHAWNLVKLGNQYYHLDTTWGANEKSKAYFLLSDDEIRSKGDRVWDTSKYPECKKSYPK